MNYEKLEQDHASMTAKLSVSGESVLQRLSDFQVELLHMAVGISGEAGELLDAIKKHIYYDKPLDYVNVVEELGDLEFYMQGLRSRLGITRDATLTENMSKLGRRYPNFQYNNQAAQDRADKK